MTPERWQQIRDVLEQALETPLDRRSAFLDQACSSDSSLRHEVEALLDASDHEISGFLQPALAGELGEVLAGDLEGVFSTGALQAGQLFAERFRLVRKLGEGGMGQVWLAGQTSPVRRQVALKLIKAGMYDDAVVQRFLLERQSLAIMDHPAIAKVFDAGTTPQGQPYFVMEYVPGLPITEYCDQRKLKIRDRLELFVQACEGVQHAHQKAIVHRDLKPANILVVEIDGKPVPRIIDFGLAKATTPQADGQSIFTQVGRFVGTPGYMSPEQADPNVHDIDTRTDVYSLGAVLYVLLTGSRPFDAKPGQKQPLDELLRRLREEEPPSPSDRVSSDRDAASATAEGRGTEPKQLVNQLRGDLDWITMKALDENRDRRYGTPSELAADVRRYLNHQAVVARPATAGYRLRKYVRRHRVAVGAVAALVLLLTAFSILQAVALRRITRERDRASRERDRADRVTGFMTRMFKVSDPSEARGNSITAREILDKASKSINKEMARDPEEQAQLMHVMGSVYYGLGLYAEAEPLLTQATEIRRRVLGPENPDSLASMAELARVVGHIHPDQEEKLLRQVMEIRLRKFGPENLETMTSMAQLANALSSSGRLTEADQLARQVVDLRRRVQGQDSVATMDSIQYLALVLTREGRYGEAEQLDRQVLEFRRRTQGGDHPDVINAEGRLAWVLYQEGDYVEAESLLRASLDIGRRVLGSGHPLISSEENILASLLADEGRYSEAEKIQREALEIQRRTAGVENSATLNVMYNLAHLLRSEGHYADAETLLRQTLQISQRVLSPTHPLRLWMVAELGMILDHEGRDSEAEKLEREALGGMAGTLGPEQPDTLDITVNLATILLHEKRYDEAEQLARHAQETDLRLLGAHHPNTADATYTLARIAARRGRTDDAFSLLRQSIDNGLAPNVDLQIEHSLDLASIHRDPRWNSLISHAKERQFGSNDR